MVREYGLKVGAEAHPLRPPGVVNRPSIVNGKTGSGEDGAMTSGTQHGNLHLVSNGRRKATTHDGARAINGSHRHRVAGDPVGLAVRALLPRAEKPQMSNVLLANA